MDEIEKIFYSTKELFLRDIGNNPTRELIESPWMCWHYEYEFVKILKDDNIKKLQILLNADIKSGSLFGILIYCFYNNDLLVKMNSAIFESMIEDFLEGYEKSDNKELSIYFFNRILTLVGMQQNNHLNTASYILKLYSHIYNLKQKNKELTDEITLLENHIDYQPNGVGYEEAKNHFNENIKNL